MTTFPVTDTISLAFANLRKVWVRNLLTALAFGVIGFVVVIGMLLATDAVMGENVSGTSFSGGTLTLDPDAADQADLSDVSTGGLLMVLLLFLSYFVIGLWAQLTMVGNALSAERGQMSLGEVMGRAIRALPGLFAAMLVLLICTMLAAAVGVLVPMFVGAASGSGAVVALMGLVAFIGYVVVLTFAMVISTPMLGAGFDGAGFGSLGRAWQLTRGKKLALLGYLLLMGLIGAAIVFGAMIVLFIVAAIAGDAGAIIFFLGYIASIALTVLLGVSGNAAAYLMLTGEAQPRWQGAPQGPYPQGGPGYPQYPQGGPHHPQGPQYPSAPQHPQGPQYPPGSDPTRNWQ